MTIAGHTTKIMQPKPTFPIKNGTYIMLKNATTERSKGKGLSKRPRNATDYEKGHQELCKNSWQNEYTMLHRHLIETKQNKFLVYKCSGAGWGNRLRDLLSSLHFSVASRRAFILYCDNPSPFDKFLAPRYIKWNHKINETGLTVRRNYKIIIKNIKNRSDPTTFQKMLNYSVEYNPRLIGSFYTFLANLVRYDLSYWPNIPQMLGCSFYYLFKKSETLQKRFNEWKEELGFNENIVIAIHIRQGDFVFHHNRGDKRFGSMKEIDVSLDCVTAVEMKIQEKYKTKKIIWFLAADSEKMKTYVKEKFGYKVKTITGPIEHIGHPTKGKEDSGVLSMFLDYFLLQEADYRLYFTISTFDNAVDFITLGTGNVGRGFNQNKRECVFPRSLKT